MADEIEPPNGQTESVYLKPGISVRIGQLISEDMVDRNRKRIPIEIWEEMKPGSHEVVPNLAEGDVGYFYDAANDRSGRIESQGGKTYTVWSQAWTNS